MYYHLKIWGKYNNKLNIIKNNRIMAKRTLLLSAFIAASATLVYADDYTSQDDKANYTYSASDITIQQKGTVVENNDITVSRTPGEYSITVTCDLTTVITNRTRKINTTLVSFNGSVSNYVPMTETIALVSNTMNNGVEIDNENVFVFDDNGVNLYTISDNALYQKYKTVCEHAASKDSRVVKFENIPDALKAEGTDDDGYEFNQNLYYMLVGGKNATKATSAVPILAVYHKCTSGTTYTNCTDIYEPTRVSPELFSDNDLSISENGKVCTVTGYVDQYRIADIITDNSKSKNCLNFDFTQAIALGEVSYDMTDNKIAYFSKNTAVSGQNIVIGSNCENYTISADKEIYVYKKFSAEDATYNRNFTANAYGTIVLPFVISNTSNALVKQAELTDYDPAANKLTFTKSPTLTANVPYMFKVNSTGASALYGDPNTPVYATATAASPEVNGAQFVGTFTRLTAEQTSGLYIVTTAGDISKSNAALKPSRCYLTRNDENGAKMTNATIEIIDEEGNVEIVEVDPEVTAIDDIDNGEVVSVKYISVNGQISNEPVNGLNIVKKTYANGVVETSKMTF